MSELKTGAKFPIFLLGNILPIDEFNFMIAPIQEQVELVYKHLGVERLLELANGFSPNNDLFMELHRRASARYFREGVAYEWDSIPNDPDEGVEDAQLERARMIMAYDAKWFREGRHTRNPDNPIPDWFGLEDDDQADKSEEVPAVIRVRGYQKQQLELDGITVTPRLLGAITDEEEIEKMIEDYLSAWGSDEV